MEKDYVQILMDGITQIVDAKIAAASKNYTAVQEATIVENHDRNSGQYTVLLDGARRLANVAESQSGVVFYLQDQVYVGNLGDRSDLIILGKKVTADTAPMIAADPFSDYIRFLKTDKTNFAGKAKLAEWRIAPAAKADIVTIALDSSITRKQNASFAIDVIVTTNENNKYKYSLQHNDFLGSLNFTEKIIRYATLDVSNLPELSSITLEVSGDLIIDWDTSFLELGKVLSDTIREEVFIYSSNEQYTYNSNITSANIKLQYTYQVPETLEYKVATDITEQEEKTANIVVYWERLEKDGVNWISVDDNDFSATIALRQDVDQEKIRVRLERVNVDTGFIETLYSNIIVYINEKETQKSYIDKQSALLELSDGTNGLYDLWDFTGQIIDPKVTIINREATLQFISLYDEGEIVDNIESIVWTYPEQYMTIGRDISGSSVVYTPNAIGDNNEAKLIWLRDSLTFKYRLLDTTLQQPENTSLVCRINFKNGIESIEVVKSLYFTQQTMAGDTVTVRFYYYNNDGQKIYTLFFPTDNRPEAEKTVYYIETSIRDSSGSITDLTEYNIHYSILNNFIGKDEANNDQYRVLWNDSNNTFKIYDTIMFNEQMRSPVLEVSIQSIADVSAHLSIKKLVPIPLYTVQVQPNEIVYQGTTEVEYDSSGFQPKFKNEPLKLYIQGSSTIGTWNLVKHIDDEYKQYEPAYPVLDTIGADVYLLPQNYYENQLPYYDCCLTFTDNNGNILLVQPLIIRKSGYVSSLIHNWDGGYHVSDDGKVLTPSLIAGSKNNKNEFTGIVAGDFANVTKDGGASQDTINGGILGYLEGSQSFGFLADGTAFIGRSGAGRIEFDGNQGIIKSAFAQLPQDGSHYSTGGMVIDLNATDANNNMTGALYTAKASIEPDGTLHAQGAQINGHIVAETGDIAGFSISNNVMRHMPQGSTTDFFIRTSGVDENSLQVGNSDAKNDWRIWLQGDKTGNVGRFGVDSKGILYATGANIEGNLEVTSGRVALFDIDGAELRTAAYTRPGDIQRKSGFRSPSETHQKNDAAFAIGYPYVTGGTTNYWHKAPFYVTFDGTLYASGAHISGQIEADTGKIGGDNGWVITTNEISSGKLGNDNSFYLRSAGSSGNVTIAGSSSKTDWRLGIGKNFGVDSGGNLFCSGSGKIGGVNFIDNAEQRFIWLEGAETKGEYISGFYSLFKENGTFTLAGAPLFYVGAKKPANGEISSLDNHELYKQIRDTAKAYIDGFGNMRLKGNIIAQQGIINTDLKINKNLTFVGSNSSQFARFDRQVYGTTYTLQLIKVYCSFGIPKQSSDDQITVSVSKKFLPNLNLVDDLYIRITSIYKDNNAQKSKTQLIFGNSRYQQLDPNASATSILDLTFNISKSAGQRTKVTVELVDDADNLLALIGTNNSTDTINGGSYSWYPNYKMKEFFKPSSCAIYDISKGDVDSSTSAIPISLYITALHLYKPDGTGTSVSLNYDKLKSLLS